MEQTRKMKQNILQKFHDEYTNCPTYNHLKNIVNTILIKDLKSYYTISERTLRRYANGDSLPKQPDIIKALAKMCKVTPEELIHDLTAYKKAKGGLEK
jgi:hypothetical protein